MAWMGAKKRLPRMTDGFECSVALLFCQSSAQSLLPGGCTAAWAIAMNGWFGPKPIIV